MLLKEQKGGIERTGVVLRREMSVAEGAKKWCLEGRGCAATELLTAHTFNYWLLAFP